MERDLHFFIGMIHEKALPVQRDVERYSDSGRAGVEQMLRLADFDFGAFRGDWAHEEIIYDILVEEFLSGPTPRRIASTVHRYLPFATPSREARHVNLLLPG